MLDTQGYKHTLRIDNTYCFSTASVVARMRLNVNFIRTLPVFPCFLSVVYIVVVDFAGTYSDTSANEDNSFRNHVR